MVLHKQGSPPTSALARRLQLCRQGRMKIGAYSDKEVEIFHSSLTNPQAGCVSNAQIIWAQLAHQRPAETA